LSNGEQVFECKSLLLPGSSRQEVWMRGDVVTWASSPCSVREKKGTQRFPTSRGATHGLEACVTVAPLVASRISKHLS